MKNNLSLIISFILLTSYILIITSSIANATTITDNFANGNNWNTQYPTVSYSNNHMVITGGGMAMTKTGYNYTIANNALDIETIVRFANGNNAYIGFGPNNGGIQYPPCEIAFGPASGGVKFYAGQSAGWSGLTSYTFSNNNDYYIRLLWNSTGAYVWVNGTYVGNDIRTHATSISGSCLVLQTQTANEVDFSQFYFNDQGQAYSSSKDIIDLTASACNVNKNSVYSPTIQRISPNNATVTVQYNTVDGTAHQGIDYQYQSGTINFTYGSIIQAINSIQIYNADPTTNKYFYVNLSSITNGIPGTNQSINITILKTGTAVLTVNKNPANIGDTVTGTLIISDVDYDAITYSASKGLIEAYDGNIALNYRKLGTQWQEYVELNNTWINVSSNNVLKENLIVSTADTYDLNARIMYRGLYVANATVTFNVNNSFSKIPIYIEVKDSYGNEILNSNITVTDSVYSSTFTDNIWGSKQYQLNQSTWYTVAVNSTGFINTTESRWAANDAQYNVWTFYLMSAGEPVDPAQTYLEVKVFDYDTNQPLEGATVKIKNTSGTASAAYFSNYPAKFQVMKGQTYTLSAYIEGYTAQTINYKVPNLHSSYSFNLHASSSTPTIPPGGSGGSGGSATYTPYTDTQRKNQANNMIDQLLQAGPGIMDLIIICVVMGLLYMIFPQGNSKKKYR